jgi:hypothetical protein
MKYTSSQAGKLLRKLNDDYNALLKKEEISKDFLVSLGENPDAIRPEYDFCVTQKELEKKPILDYKKKDKNIALIELIID